MMIPESTTPSVAPITEMPPHAPIAFARSAGVCKQQNDQRQRGGAASAPPRPWAKREMIIIVSLCASPLAAEATANRTVPMMNIRLRPNDVRDSSSDDQEAARHQGVAIDDPGQALSAETQVGLDRRQRHVDDRAVENEHELRQSEQRHRHPPPRICR